MLVFFFYYINNKSFTVNLTWSNGWLEIVEILLELCDAKRLNFITWFIFNHYHVLPDKMLW